MPRRDGTGPSGLGPFTGRGLGSCDKEDMRLYPRYGRASARMGRGRRGFFQNAISEDRREMLVEEKNALTKRLEAIDNMLKKESKEQE